MDLQFNDVSSLKFIRDIRILMTKSEELQDSSLFQAYITAIQVHKQKRAVLFFTDVLDQDHEKLLYEELQQRQENAFFFIAFQKQGDQIGLFYSRMAIFGIIC